MPSELRTEPVFDALKQPLALVESDERRRQIEGYLETARVPLERAVYDLMSQLVEAIDLRPPPGSPSGEYRLRLGWRDRQGRPVLSGGSEMVEVGTVTLP